MIGDAVAESSAKISPCGRFRYKLVRRWDKRQVLLVCMFNPSTADASKNDQTITLLCHLASWNGFGGIVVVNLCPLRSSTPLGASELLRDRRKGTWSPYIVENEWAIRREAAYADGVLVAWGALAEQAHGYEKVVLELIRQSRQSSSVWTLGLTQAGHPIHPMARGKHKVERDRKFIRWEIPA